MKKFALKIFVLLFFIVIVDYLVGTSFDYLGLHTKGGDTARHNYINYGTNEELLVMGSSRAFHHYVPQIMEDSLNLSVYNCGQNANGILLCYMQLCNILDRYSPKVIVYDVMPEYDYFEENDNSKYLGWERRFYGSPSVDSVFWDIDTKERYKMLSNAYRYNSKFMFLFSDYIHPYHEYKKGYSPIDGVIDYEIPEQKEILQHIDSLKYSYIKKFIQKCKNKNVDLVFTASPVLAERKDKFGPLVQIASQYNIPFINHYQDSSFLYHRDFFSDVTHMNHVGAELYTKIIVSELDSILYSTKTQVK